MSGHAPTDIVTTLSKALDTRRRDGGVGSWKVEGLARLVDRFQDQKLVLSLEPTHARGVGERDVSTAAIEPTDKKAVDQVRAPTLSAEVVSVRPGLRPPVIGGRPQHLIT
jgi:hypothetical protein